MAASSPAPHSALGRIAERARRPLLAAFRVTPEGRAALVRNMLTRQVHEAPMYWLQLVLAMAIATLGLALGSTVVVIGAMLISPLMTPLVELGMGLAVGLPVLVGRSFVRFVASVAVVVLGAALITTALPFHEVTAPIAARAAPTALDLLVAICCALMASFATVAAGSAMATTAAGTALAIALVPPLCVVGFGLGTGQLAIARGAALLFVASFSAIMLFAVLVFTAFGFGEVGPQRRWGVGAALRIAMPLLLLCLVYLPLRRALAEVVWEVHARQAIRAELDALSEKTVQSEVDVARHAVRIKLVIVGDPLEAQTLKRALGDRIAEAAGVRPTLDVVALGDARAVHEAMQLAQTPKVEVVHEPDLRTTTARLADVLARSWPRDSAGQLVAWRLDAGADGTSRLEVVHFGDALGPDARDVLGRDLSDAAGEPVAVDDRVLPHEPLTAPPPEGAAWLAQITPLLDEVARFDALHACLGVPWSTTEVDAGRAKADAGMGAAAEGVGAALLAAAARVPDGRAQLAADASWSLRLQTDPCSGPTAAPDGGRSVAASAVDASRE